MHIRTIVLSFAFVVMSRAPVREILVRAGGIDPVDPALSFKLTVMHKNSAKLSAMQATETRPTK